MISTAQKSAVALIVAAGSGTRAGGGLPKQYRRIGGEAVIARAFDALASHPDITGVHIVIGAGQEELLAAALDGRQPASISAGGATRRDSVVAGLQAIAVDGVPDVVLIHDAARPFLPAAVVDRLLDALETRPGAVPTLTVVDTLVRNDDGALGDTVPREGLARVRPLRPFISTPFSPPIATGPRRMKRPTMRRSRVWRASPWRPFPEIRCWKSSPTKPISQRPSGASPPD